ncbi:MAG TPA: GNAT family N-acetyltransferase [Gaiella sp.]|nr:GNAT family N-acetyltransferase [Gaiella sp.]
MEVERIDGATGVRAALGELLLADEARHNLPLGLLAVAEATPEVYPELLGWAVRDGGRVVGGALRTPPFNLVVVRAESDAALEALAGALPDDLPGAVGAVPEVDALAAAWASPRDLDVTTRVDQRIYVLREVVEPTPAAGSFRLAGASDRALVLERFVAFAEEIHEVAGVRGEEQLERAIDARLASAVAGVGLWEVEGEVVSLAGFGGPTPNGMRIGPVHTPAAFRRRGYGTAVTAAVSRLQLERGRTLCFLYTDLANPTSNAIYRRIGYVPVCDSREVAFVAR